ncbi:hypothetical protein DERF_011575 [Dermatophagoides farinae]|uniref:Uncharacterized protein n=1 Tax=Dermatophagoides farinae TaxID=6954 RepID=A0A922HWC8_DERFA|nr:hypothetical protein DERF_011575 [Dermatophagoides farinae]
MFPNDACVPDFGGFDTYMNRLFSFIVSANDSRQKANCILSNDESPFDDLDESKLSSNHFFVPK